MKLLQDEDKNTVIDYASIHIYIYIHTSVCISYINKYISIKIIRFF